MNKSNTITLAALLAILASCKDTAKDSARQLLNQAQTEYRAGRYDAALAAIDTLRHRYPTAIEERRKALALWQDATERKAQSQVALLDQQLQATGQAIDSLQHAASGGASMEQKLQLNRLRHKKDSLQAQFDAQCALVRIVREKRKS